MVPDPLLLPPDLRPYATARTLALLLALAELSPLPSDPESARFLGYSTRTLRRKRRQALLRSVSVAGGHPRIPRAELARVLCEGAS